MKSLALKFAALAAVCLSFTASADAPSVQPLPRGSVQIDPSVLHRLCIKPISELQQYNMCMNNFIECKSTAVGPTAAAACQAGYNACTANIDGPILRIVPCPKDDAQAPSPDPLPW